MTGQIEARGAETRPAPAWAEHVMWWHVYPLGVDGRDVRGEHQVARPGEGMDRLAAWLDHVVALGLNGVLLGPVHRSATHGYDTLDHRALDPRLGDEESFDSFLAAARERGVRVLLDGVFHHVGRDHPLVARALAGDEHALAMLRHETGPDGRPRLVVFEGHEGLVALDHGSPAVADHVVDVLDHWLARGVDGWRLDAAYAVDPTFWANVLPRVRERHPDAWFVGEMIHGDYAGYAEQGTLDSVTQYELWKAVWSSLLERNPHELDWTLRRHDALLGQGLVPQTFVGNHDVTRIASRVGARDAALAVLVLMTVGGVPSVYAGDELGWEGVKEDRLGGDDAVRPALPARPEEAPGIGGTLARVHRETIGLRRRHPWLVRARTQVLHVGDGRLTYRSAVDGEGEILVELDLTDDGGGRARVLVGGTPVLTVGE